METQDKNKLKKLKLELKSTTFGLLDSFGVFHSVENTYRMSINHSPTRYQSWQSLQNCCPLQMHQKMPKVLIATITTVRIRCCKNSTLKRSVPGDGALLGGGGLPGAFLGGPGRGGGGFLGGRLGA